MRGRKGFTLIELLVVIAIIGILSTIVLINLNAARNKAKDAAVKGALAELRAAAEMAYDDASPNSYATVCDTATPPDINTTGDFGRIKTSISDNTPSTAVRTCNAGVTAWCAQVTGMATGGSWCVDSTGVSGTTAVCDVATFDCATDI